MAREFQTIIRVGMNSTDFNKSSTEVNRRIKLLDSSFKEASSRARAFGETTDTLKQKQTVLTEKISIQKSKLKELGKRYEQSKQDTGENSKATENLAIQYNKAITNLNKMEGSLKKVNTDLGKQKNNFNSTSAKITEYGKKAAKGIAMVTAAMAAMAAGALKLALDIGNVADRLLDLNSITGMSTDEIQRWQHAAVVAGTELETVTNASQQLSKNLTTMESETNKSRQALKTLRLSLSEIKNSTADEQMNKIITALQGVEDKTERAKIGTDLFGKKWQELAPIIDLGIEGLKDAKNNANVFTPEQLDKANNFRIKWDEIKYSFQQVALIVGNKLIPVIEVVLDRLGAKMPKIEERIQKFLLAVSPIITVIGSVLVFIIDNIQILLPLILGIVAAIAALKIISFIGNLKKGFGELGGSATKVALIIVGVVAALTALAAVIAIIMGRDLGKAFDDVGKGVSNVADSVASQMPTDQMQNRVNGSHRSGLSRVPFDGYRAELHEDEEVLTADDPRNVNNKSKTSYRNLVSSSPKSPIYYVYHNNIYVDAQTTKEYNDMVEMATSVTRTRRAGKA